MSDSKQKTAFLTGEGDRWFERNQAHLSGGTDDIVVAAVDYLGIRPKAIFEIGAANGHRLAAMTKSFGASGAGIDPSAAAIEDGKATFPQLDLKVASADELPFESGAFDLVIVGFCMYLVDPAHHFKAVAEADRLLADGGAMVVFDFLADQPYHNDYAHLPGLRAHKMEYARMFMSHPSYSLVHRQLARKSENFLEPDWREGVDILVKNAADAFPANPRKR